MVMQASGMTFDNLGWTDLEADNSLMVMSTFVQSCKNNPPMRVDQSGPYDSETVKKAFSTGIMQIKRKFSVQIRANPSGEYFPAETVTECRRAIGNNHGRNMMEGPDESELYKSIYPLPRKHNNSTLLLVVPGNSNHHMSAEARNWDLHSVCSELFKRRKFAQLAEVITTNNSVGRAGESKYLNLKTMYPDLTFGATFASKFQRKLVKSTPVCFVVDFEHPEMCWYFVLGCYFACDNGLARPDGLGEPNSPKRRKANFLFPELHGIKDSSVASRVGNTIKSVVPDSLKNALTAKSLRYGTMSKLAWDPAVTYEESVALGGWTTNSNRDWYVWTYLVALLPPALTLAGYPDCRVIPHLPSCGMLFHHPQLANAQQFQRQSYQRFIRKLYTTDIPEFDIENSPQRNLLVIVTAAMVMHFDYCYTKHGIQFSYCRKMVESVLQCGVPFADTTANSIELLTKWSRIVKDDFKRGNQPGQDRPPIGQLSVMDHIAKMNDSVAKMLSWKVEQQRQQQLIHERLDELTETVSHLNSKCATLTELLDCVVTQNRHLQLRMHQLMAHHGIPVDPLPDTPQAARRSQVTAQAVARNLQQANVGAQPTNTQTSPLAPTPRRQQVPTQNRTVNNVLQRHTAGNSNPRGSRVNEHKLEVLLMTMYNAPRNCVFGSMIPPQPGRLSERATWIVQKSFPNSDRQTKQKVERVLNFVDGIWTPEDRIKILNHSLPDPEALRYFRDLANKAKEVAWLICSIRKYNKAAPNRKKHVLPKKTRPGKQCGTQILGIANNLGTFEFQDYIPDYDKPGFPRKSIVSLEDKGQQMSLLLAGYIRQNR